MARENKAKRDAKRLGTSERLADNLLTGKHALLDGFPKTDAEKRHDACICMELHDLAKLNYIDATNVWNYTQSIQTEKKLGFMEMIRGAVPPFRDCFVEIAIPESFAPQVRNIGWGIGCFEKPGMPRRILEILQSGKLEMNVDKCNFVVEEFMSLRCLTNPYSGEAAIIPLAARCCALLDVAGNAVIPTILSVDPRWGNVDQFDIDWISM